MKDITATEIKEITRQANESIDYAETKFQYLEAYKEFNEMILEKARAGENSIILDFINSSDDNHGRIYASYDGGQASYGANNYPNYLLSKGFNVEIRKSLGQHRNITKAYFISW
jgi:hypothetical protein